MTIKYLLPITTLFILFGCSFGDDKNMTLVCVEKSTQVETNLVTKKESTNVIENNRIVFKFENGKYNGHDCKYTKDEIICNTSKPEDETWGELKINRVSGGMTENLDFVMKNGLGQVYIKQHLTGSGVCEKSKDNKF
jgi:hypothetical protein